MRVVKRALRALGKSDRKIAAVFATTRAASQRSVDHLRENLNLPIFLITLEEPAPQTAAECERVLVLQRPMHLWLRAQRELWPYWTALCVGDWTGKPGNWALKVAPFCIPPFRMLFLNESGDLFPGSFGAIGNHVARRAREWRVSAAHRSGDLARGVGLFCFAFVAQWCSPVSRFAFRRMKREMRLSISNTPPSGEGVARFGYKGREWNRTALMKLLVETDARWILFEQVGNWGAAEDLAAPFSDRDAFVVSRQTGEREWRKLLFATAPFRGLQQDECARVLAPVSPQMLVDRAKLAALGVPNLSSFGSNWFFLFWKAAAAGWNSYSVGGKDEPGELAAVPYDEAEFVKTLLNERDLRCFAPVEPALSRGTIAQSTMPGPGFRELPRVLVVSPYLPFPLSHGGAVRIYNLCRALRDRVDFVLACFREKGEYTDYGKLHEVFREVFVVDIDERNADPALPKQVSEYESSSMRALIARLCRDMNIDVLQVEYTQMAAYREAAPTTPAILVEHDLTFTLYAQLAERDPAGAVKREYGKWLLFERDRLRAFEIVWTMSEFDRRRAVTEGSSPDATAAVPNGVDLRRFTCEPKQTLGDEIFYVGSFRHRPNYLGFEELVAVIMPSVWRQFPDTQLRVVAGPDHLKHWPGPKILDPRIAVHGFVEDLIPLYREASLVVVPLPISAGTNIKVMEALACERVVVTTPVGCAGLELEDGTDAVIRELGPGFAAAICELLADPRRREGIAAAGRQTAEARFSWESIAETAYESYERLLPQTSRLAASPCA